MAETETEIAWHIVRGELPSPQYLPGFALFSLRFSGTGTAWREAHQEHVFRPPEQYLNPEMSARIAGVPVVTVHPDANGLDSETYGQTVIGAICFGYVADGEGVQSNNGDELWCIARVNDASAAKAMATGKFSTSPAVIFAPDSGNEMIPLLDGTRLLIEGRPVTIDHLAACIDAGVWDKGGPASGIRTDSTGERKTMTDEEIAADKARKDAEGVTIDKLLSTLDTISARLDAIEKGSSRADADAEHAEWMRDDAAGCARDDADEEADRKELEGRGIPKDVAHDAARRARKDRMKARQDGTKPTTPSHGRMDAAKEREEDHAKADAQSRADAVAQMFGSRAPAPMMGESSMNYRKRLLRNFARHSTFAKADFDTIAADAATFANVENIVYADAAEASKTPDVPSGQLLKRTRTTETGHVINEFFGNETFIKQLRMPSKYVTEFLTPRNRAA